MEVNKTGSFSFLIYPEHPYFDRLEKLSSIVKVFRDNDLIFRGRILNDEEGFYNEKQVSCEGELAFLCDSIQRPYDFRSGENHTTVQDLFTFFIQNHNSQVEAEKRFIVGNITVADPNNYIVRSDSTYLNTWDSINKKLIEGYGGYLRVRHEQSGNYIDYLADFNVISNQTIEFGKNLLDFDKKIKGEQIVTAIIPLGAKEEESGEQEEQALETRLTIADLPDDETGEICKKSDYVYSKSAVQRYGWIFKTITWDGVTQASNLQSKAEAELSQSINQAVTIELNGFDLSALNQDVSGFKIGTYIRIKTAPHNINSNFLVKKLSIDLTNPATNSLTLGATYLSFTERSNGKNNAILEGVKTQIADTKTEINNSNNALIQELHNQIGSEIVQNSSEILTKVSNDYYLQSDAQVLIESINTQFQQTSDSFEFQFNEFQQNLEDVQNGTDAQFQQITKYIRFVDGNIILGEDGNKLVLRIENDKISFLENNVVIAYWQNRKFYAVDGEFLSSLKLGNFSFIPRQNGNLSFKKVT